MSTRNMMSAMMVAAALALPLALSTTVPLVFGFSKPAQSSGTTFSVSDISVGMPYDEARKAILLNGWAVMENSAPDDLVLVARAMYDKGYIEVDICAPTGNAPCVFYFMKSDNEFLRVLTSGENPIVTGAETLDAVGYNNARRF